MKKSTLLRLLRVMARFCVLSLGVFMVLLVSAFLLSYYFSGNLIDYYRRQAERSLNVSIDIHKAQLQGTRVRLEGVQIQTRGGVPLARIERVEAPLQIWQGLRHGSARWVERVQLTRPSLELAYDGQGRFNWDSVTLPRRLAGAPLESAFRGHIAVSEASLSLRDQRRGSFLCRWEPIQASLDYRPAGDWTATADVQSRSLQLRAQSLPGQPLRVDGDLKGLSLDALLLHPDLLDLARCQGTQANGSLHLRWVADNPSASLVMGQLKLAAREVKVAALGQPLRNLAAEVRLLGSSLDIAKARVLWNGTPFDLSGQVRPSTDGESEPWVKLKVESGPLVLSRLASLPKSGLPPVKGTARLEVEAEGPLQDPALQGRLQVSDLEVAGQTLKDLQADFALNREGLHLTEVVMHDHEGRPTQASGWLFPGEQNPIYLRVTGAPGRLDGISPWLAGTEQVQATLLGSLLDPIVTGRAQLGSLPFNPLGLTSGGGEFWLDRKSAVFWNSQLRGGGGQVEVPWAILDFDRGQLAAASYTQQFQLALPQGQARVQGGAEFVADLKKGQLEGLAYLEDGQFQAPGLPTMENLSGCVGYLDNQVLVPQLHLSHRGDRLDVTGSLDGGKGHFYLDAPQIDPSHWLAGLPSGSRNLSAEAHIQGSSLEGFRLASQGTTGDAYAVGRWLSGRPPEVFAQFTNLQTPEASLRLDGQLATAWEGGRLNYFYGASPSRPGKSAGPSDWLAGQGWLDGSRVVMRDNFLRLPVAHQTRLLEGEGRAYSYFGPVEGPPLQVWHPAEPWASVGAGGTLSWNGILNFKTGRIQELKVRARELNLRQVVSWFGPLPSPTWWNQTGVKLEDLLVDADGTASGSWGQLQGKASLRSSWTRFSRQAESGPESIALSWRTEAELAGGKLKLLSLVSPHPQDSRLLTWKGPRSSPPEDEWLRSRLEIDSGLGWSGWLRSTAFPVANARWFTPPWISSKLPSGVLSTQGEGLQIRGSVFDPQLAGRIDLHRGRFWTGYAYMPVDEAYADFTTQGKSTLLSRLHLCSQGLTLEGSGYRSQDGSLSAKLWADDLPLDTLAQFGWNTRGWKGTLDLACQLRDAKGVTPEGWLALEAYDLKPAEGPFGIRRLVLGSIQREQGIPSTGPGSGIAFRLRDGEVVVDLPPQGAEIVWDNPRSSRAQLEGQVSWRAAPRPEQSLVDWVRAADGPRFGSGGQAFKLELENLGWPLLRQFLGLSDDRRQGLISGSLALYGQYFEQHRLSQPKLSGRPLMATEIREFVLEGPGAVWSGMQLRNPLKLAYSLVPGNAWLRLEPATWEFFQKASEQAPAVIKGTLNLEAAMVAMESPALKKGTPPPQDQSLKLQVQDLPLQNLAFLLPDIKHLGGLVQELELLSRGPLSQPQASLKVSAKDLEVQRLRVTGAQGGARLTSEKPGLVQLDFGEGAEELRFLLGAVNDLNQALVFQGQATLDFDRDILMRQPSLRPVWQGWRLSDRSQFDLSARLNDSQMRLLSLMAPEGSQLSGALKVGLDLKGTSAKPELTGSMTLENGGFIHPQLSTPLTGFNMAARFERIKTSEAEQTEALGAITEPMVGRISLDRLEGALGGQPFQGKGKAEMAGRTPTFLNFELEGNELPVNWDGLMDGKANIHLTLTGRAQEKGGLHPLLVGRIEVPEANLSLPSQETLERLKGLGKVRRRPFSYDLDLSLGNDVWGGFLGSAIRATGDLKILSSSSSMRPLVRGDLFLSRGVIRLPVYLMTFRVRQGRAIFEDDLMPRIENLEADGTLGSYRVMARFDGTYPNLQADLVSNPPLPESDLRRLIGGGGMPTASPSANLASTTVDPNANSFLVNQGVSILSSYLTGALSQDLGRLLFASELSFDILPSSEYAIRLAKALDEKDTFLLTFSQAIGTTRFNQSLTQYGIEWRFRPDLLSRVTLDNYGQARLWFQGVLRF